MTAPKTERNKQIFEDKKTMSYTQLIQKYGLSMAALQRIVARQQLKELQDDQQKAQG